MSCFVASPAVGCTVVAMSELPFLILDSCHYLRFLSFRAQRGICSFQFTTADFLAFFPFGTPRKAISSISPANFAAFLSTRGLHHVLLQFMMPTSRQHAVVVENVHIFYRLNASN